MHTTRPRQLWPLKPNVLDAIGFKASAAFAQVADGLLPPPVACGRRAKRYVSDEIQAVVEARVTGASDDEIKSLVLRLVAARSQGAAALDAA